MFLQKIEKFFSTKLIVFYSILVGVVVVFLVWDICFWPTDTEVYYLPAAQKLFSYQYLSQIHQALDAERVKWLHGKEIFVFTIALFQKLFNDMTSLRPIMILGVVCHVISSIFLYINFKQLWGKRVALVSYVLFLGCVWPYVYILFGKHQTQGLTFFLAAVFFLLQKAEGWRYLLNMFLVGLLMGAAFFSSTVSVMYFPYLFLLGGWKLCHSRPRCHSHESGNLAGGNFSGGRVWIPAFAGMTIFLIGFCVILLWVTYPNVLENTKSFFDYVGISSDYNHFFYNQVTLHQWLPQLDPQSTRGGWIWVIKYFFLMMPVIFILSIVAAGYLLIVSLRGAVFATKQSQESERLLRAKNALAMTGIIAICFSTPILIEIKKIAQYGANYFPVLIGMIGLIAYALNQFLQSDQWKRFSDRQKNQWLAVAGIILVGHLIYNVCVFSTDVLPSRMGTAYLARTLKALDVRSLDTYKLHPLRPNVVDVLPLDVLKRIQWTPMANILQGSSEYVLVPPVSKDTIYLATKDYTDFDDDIFLNTIVKKGDLKKYAVASFSSIGSSLVWSQEEEILAYRYLVLNQFPARADKSRIWLLDRKKIEADKQNFLPSAEDIFAIKNGVRNIGTQSLVYMFKGYQSKAAPGTKLEGIAARIYKVGNPQDDLVAYLYRVDDTQPLWVPFDKQFRSKPLLAQTLTNNPEGQIVRFEFAGVHALNDQPFMVAIYRTGHASDDNYYRVYESFIGRLEEK